MTLIELAYDDDVVPTYGTNTGTQLSYGSTDLLTLTEPAKSEVKTKSEATIILEAYVKKRDAKKSSDLEASRKQALLDSYGTDTGTQLTTASTDLLPPPPTRPKSNTGAPVGSDTGTMLSAPLIENYMPPAPIPVLSGPAPVARPADFDPNPAYFEGAEAYTRALQPSVAFIKQEESFRSEPYYDVNAWRAGWGSDTYTDASGGVHTVLEGQSVSQEDADRDIFRRIATEFEPGIRKRIGEEAFQKLTPEQRAALNSLAYNYGVAGVPDAIVEAVKAGDFDAVDAAIREQSSNASRRGREADLFTSAGGEEYKPPASIIDSVAADEPYGQDTGVMLGALKDSDMPPEGDGRFMEALTAAGSMVIASDEELAALQAEIDQPAWDPGLLGNLSPLIGMLSNGFDWLSDREKQKVYDKLAGTYEDDGWFGSGIGKSKAVSYVPIRDDDGNIVGALGVDADGNFVDYSGATIDGYTGPGEKLIAKAPAPPPSKSARPAPAAPTDPGADPCPEGYIFDPDSKSCVLDPDGAGTSMLGPRYPAAPAAPIVSDQAPVAPMREYDAFTLQPGETPESYYGLGGVDLLQG